MLRALLLAPFLILLIAFALSNPQPVTLALWPTDLSLEAPLSIAVLVSAGAFFVLGAFIVWVPGLGHRWRARRAERRAARLHAAAEARAREDAKAAQARTQAAAPGVKLLPGRR